MGGLRSAALLLAVPLIATACGTTVFFCQQDGQCGDGLCLEEGYCGFPDDACPSGVRYGEHAGGGLAGTCAAAPGGGTTGAAASSSSEGEPMGTTATPVADGSSGSSTASTSSTETAASSSGLADTGIECDQWWDSAWPARRALIVERIGGASLVDFPAPLRLDRFDALADGAETLRFVGDGCQVLPHELERSANGVPLIAWVRLPAVGGREAVHVYYGNPDAEGATDAAAVWGEDTRAVWHLPAIEDASGEANDLEGPGPPSTPGVLGEAGSFDGTLIQAPATESLALGNSTEFSVSGWVRVDMLDTAATARIVDKSEAVSSMGGFAFSVQRNADLDVEIILDRGSVDGELSIISVGAPLSDNAWHHVAGIYDSGEVQLMVDGEVLPQDSIGIGVIGVPGPDIDTPVTLGGAPYSMSRFLIGAIDDVRIARVARSPEWMAAEHAAGVGMLLSLGGEEAAP